VQPLQKDRDRSSRGWVLRAEQAGRTAERDAMGGQEIDGVVRGRAIRHVGELVIGDGVGRAGHGQGAEDECREDQATKCHWESCPFGRE